MVHRGEPARDRIPPNEHESERQGEEMSVRLLLTASVAAILAVAAASRSSAAEIEGLPKPGPPRPAKIIEPQEKTLANGLRVIVVERPGLPLVSATVLVRSGSEADP